jgi:hypothetical protein
VLVQAVGARFVQHACSRRVREVAGGSVAAYVIDQGEVLDPERYEEYKVKAMQAALDWYRGRRVHRDLQYSRRNYPARMYVVEGVT